MVQRVPFTSASGNTMTIGTGTSRVIMGADSGNLKIQDSDSNTSIIEAGSGIVGASAVSVVATPAALPFSPISSAGSMAYAQSTGTLYISNGSGWYKVSMVNTAPSISISSVNANPTTTNLTLDFTYTVTEPEGTPTTVTFANSGISTTDVATVTHTSSNNHVRIVFDGETAITGATVTLSVTDGVNTGTGTITINTAYSIANLQAEVLTVMAANPYSYVNEKQHSTAFDGSGDYLSIDSHADFGFGTGNWTVECWYYLDSSFASANKYLFDFGSNGLRIQLYNGTIYLITSSNEQATTTADGTATGQWHHIAATRNSGSVYLYLNGVQRASVSTSMNMSATALRIGAYGSDNSNYTFDGKISNFRVVKGTAVYTDSTYTVPTTPLTVVSGTSLLHWHAGLADGSSTGHTITANGQAAYNTLSPFSTVNTYNNKFVRDKSTSAHTLELKGTQQQSWTGTLSPYNEYSIHFDGDSDYLYNQTCLDGFSNANDDFTIEFWAWPRDWDPNHATGEAIFGINQKVGTAYNNILLYMDKHVSFGDESPGQVSNVKSLNKYRWTHVALTYDGSSNTMYQYQDGLLTQSYSWTCPTSLNNCYLTLGGEIDSNFSFGNYYNGYLHDLRISNNVRYSGSFTPPNKKHANDSNTKLLYARRGANIDESSGYHHFYQAGDKCRWVPWTPYARSEFDISELGGSIYFDNTSSGRLETTDKTTNEIQLGNGDFTIELWYNIHNYNTDWEAIISKAYNVSGGWRIYKNTSSGSVKWYGGSGGSSLMSTTGLASDSEPADDGSVLRDDTWYHIAIVRNSGTVKTYINGKERASVADTTNYTTSTAYEIEIGSGSVTSTYPTKGHIADVRIVSGTAVYTGNFTAPSGLLTPTGGTYPSTTNVNTSIPSGHTKLLVNGGEYSPIRDISGSMNVENAVYTGSNFVESSNLKQKFTGQPSLYFPGDAYLLFEFDNARVTGSFEDYENWTIEGYHYLYPSQPNSYVCLFSGDHNGSDADSIWLYAGHASHTTTQYQVYIGTGSSPDIEGGTILYNQWAHFALVRGGNQISLFINGQLVGSRYTYNDDFLVTPGDKFSIGNSQSRIGTSEMYGFLENFRISKSLCLYPFVTEFKALTTTNTANPAIGTISASNTKLIMANSSSSVTAKSGADVSNITLTSNGDPEASSIAPYTNGGSLLLDGNDYVSAVYQRGPTNELSIDLHPSGGNDYIYAGQDSGFAFGTGDFTVELWIYPVQLVSGVHQMVLDTVTPGASGATAGRVALYLNPDKMAVYTPGIGTTTASSGTMYAKQWYHCAWTRESGTIKMWLNGTEVHSYSNSYNMSSTYLTLGKDAASGGAGQARAKWSNLRIVKGTAVYTSSFTPPTSVLTAISGTSLLIAQGNTTDNSGNDHHDEGDFVVYSDGSAGVLSQDTLSPYGSKNSVYFDGNGDYLTIPDSGDFNFSTGNGDFTIESWIYKTNTSESGWYTQRDNSTTELMVFLDHNISGYSAGSVSIEYDSAQYTFDAGIEQNKWQHIALVRTGTTVKWFTDGVEKDSRTEPASLANYGHTVYIGTWRNLTRYYQGYISNFRIVNGTAIYTSNFTVPSSALTAVTNTKLLTAQSKGVFDNSSSSHVVTMNGNVEVLAKSPFYGDTPWLIEAGDDFAIEYYLKHNTEVATGTEMHHMVNPVSNGLQIFKDTSNNLKLRKYGVADVITVSDYTHIFVPHKWHHVCLQRVGGLLELYLNGNVVGGLPSDTSAFVDGTLQIGGNANYFNGHISNLRFIKGSGVYTNSFTPPASRFK